METLRGSITSVIRDYDDPHNASLGVTATDVAPFRPHHLTIIMRVLRTSPEMINLFLARQDFFSFFVFSHDDTISIDFLLG